MHKRNRRRRRNGRCLVD